MDDLCRIVLADGKVIEAELSGNTYITDYIVDETVLADENLTHITINDTDYYNMHCVNVWQFEGLYRFILRELTSTELMKLELTAKIEYLAMISGIDIDF